MKNIGILGYGEIGSSLAQLYRMSNLGYNLKIIDPLKEKNDSFDNLEVLNICIPYTTSEIFVSTVSGYISKYNPKLVIIHSTTVPGTIKEIAMKTKNKNIGHSFVRGIHPHLTESLQKFVKYIGADNHNTADLIAEHFKSLGISPEIMSNSRSSELAKLLSTTQYGLNIAFADCMEKMCKKYDVDYYEVVNEPNKTYNEGYQALGYPQYSRYQLIPPSYFDPENDPPKIGAHCVSENLELLLKVFPNDPGLLFIKRYSKFN